MNNIFKNIIHQKFPGMVIKFSRMAIASVVLSLSAGPNVFSQEAADNSAQLAATVPIADVHMHLFKGLTPTDLHSAMDRNNVRWGGGVGPVGPGYDPKDFIKELGARYFPGGAQAEQFSMFQSGGERELLNEDSPQLKALLEKLEQQFILKEIFGIGELILSNKKSTAMPGFDRKVKIDAQALQQYYRLAEKHDGFVQIHMDGDPDSIAEFEKIAQGYPKTPFILSHCMSRSNPQSAREVLERNSNVYCETSYRSTARNNSPFLRPYMIHTAYSTESSWLDLIEAMPDRFMVGSDVYSKDVQYDTVIAAIRSGLLAKLSEPTLKKVAFENAKRVFHLE